MSGRGDNNKNGTSGQGAGNQSNQPFVADDKNQPASNHRKEQTGGEGSQDQRKSMDPDANRGQGQVDRPTGK